jgi:cardiolipin synthase
VPRPAFTEAHCDASERGVDVRILAPGSHIDKAPVRTAGRAAYAELLAAGVRLFEYRPTMLHAKSLVVDERWAMVGTMNFDNRSFQLHDEVTLGVWSERFNERLRRSFEADLERCEEIDETRWRRRPLRMRIAEGATKFIRREL